MLPQHNIHNTSNYQNDDTARQFAVMPFLSMGRPAHYWSSMIEVKTIPHKTKNQRIKQSKSRAWRWKGPTGSRYGASLGGTLCNTSNNSWTNKYCHWHQVLIVGLLIKYVGPRRFAPFVYSIFLCLAMAFSSQMSTFPRVGIGRHMDNSQK